MSSQDEYMDQLINDLTDDLAKEGMLDIPGEKESADESVLEDNIAEDDDLMSLLQGSDDEDLKEIQDLLQKADNNEPINDDIIAMLEGIPDDNSVGMDIPQVESDIPDLDDLLGTDIPEEDIMSVGVDPIEALQEEEGSLFDAQNTQPQQANQSLVAAKAARKAAKEAKKAEKLAQKEAKKAEKLAKKAEQQEERRSKKTKHSVAEENVTEATDVSQGILFDEVGVDENLEDVPVIEDVADEVQVVDGISEDELFAGIASLDLFGDIGLDADGMPETVDTSGEDSLAQVISDEKKAGKKSFFTRFMEFITEEDEEEEKENENLPVSDENREIMDEMDKKGKKKKKDKKLKKNSKGKNSKGEEGEGAEGEETEGAEKNGNKKKKKEKKPKKEKAPKVVEVASNGSKNKKLPVRKVMAILGVGFSLIVIITVATTFFGDFTVKRAGKKAYYEGNYQECYQNLYGKELNESEQVMYNKSESILTMRMWLREYELLAAEPDAQLEALDSLIQSVYQYPTLYAHASEWNAGTEVAEIYSQMVAILSEKYHLSEAQAMEIASTENDVVYTKMVMAIAAGEAFGSWNDEDSDAKVEEQEEVLKDVLPEEADLGDSSFVDNK